MGWELGERERRVLAMVPPRAWQIAVDHRGEVGERRADDACADRQCGHRRCWVEETHITELTGLLRAGPAGDQLAGWPVTLRIFARSERPRPGAQLILFEAADGWRYSLWVTNLPAATRGWRGQPAYIDARHRVHARVEDSIRTCGCSPSTAASPTSSPRPCVTASCTPPPGAPAEPAAVKIKAHCMWIADTSNGADFESQELWQYTGSGRAYWIEAGMMYGGGNGPNRVWFYARKRPSDGFMVFWAPGTPQLDNAYNFTISYPGTGTIRDARTCRS